MLSVSLTHAKINKTIESPIWGVCIYSFLTRLSDLFFLYLITISFSIPGVKWISYFPSSPVQMR